MKRFDYNFSEYQAEFNKTAKKILKESFDGEFDAESVSDQIDEAQITYNKIQKILNCPEMIKSHAYLYALDMENVDECDRQKIDKLYELGKARGVIQEDDDKQCDDGNADGENNVDECGDENVCGGPDDALTGQEMTPGDQKQSMSSAAFTVLYSAMKDGQVKTGEFFSSATDMDAAKADCISNLSPLGYSSIRILGIEQTNNAVEGGVGNLAEDDSKEFEDQETGAGDTNQDAGEDNKADGEKSGGGNDNDAGSDNGDKNDDASKTDDGKGVEKTDDKGTDGDKTENADGATKDDDDKKENPDDNRDEDAPKKLTPTEKQVLRDEYVGLFKSELQRTKLEKSVEEMSIKEKADFWGTISQKWTKQDPEEFMSDKEIEKLNKTVIKNS